MALVFLVNLAYTIVGMIWFTVLTKIWDNLKEKFWDTVLGKICDTVLEKIGDYVAGPIWQLFSQPPKCTNIIPNKNFTAFNSRRLNMEYVIKALTNDKINLIGICGLPGVGKTTIVKEVAKQAKGDGLFVEVAWASVGQKPKAHVQDCIADMLGLKELRVTKSPNVRADLLRERLLRDNKKILVILDDIWEEIDLEDMGIPLGGANKNFKMLYTSRIQQLWHNPQTKEEIPLEVLSKDEAWQLFREKAGDLADARDLQPIAKRIVNECGRLPLALVLIGSVLSKKSGRNAIEIWKGMLDRLTCASSTPVDERLSKRLELSYEYLEDDEEKRLFLICCLFQEDEDICIEDLARYVFGLSVFDGINEMGKVRSRVFLIVDDLKSRYLLLDSKEEKGESVGVKVHDVVRDMGISIASKDKYALLSHGVASRWPKKDTYEHYAAMSMISSSIAELPEGLSCPNLELLLLECNEPVKLPSNFFDGMEKLKVLALTNFDGILKLQSLTNLRTLSLQYYGVPVHKNVSGFGALFNLEILNFRYSSIEELPEELGELVNLRLLDLGETNLLERIPPGVISRLVHLEELYVLPSSFNYWEGEGKEEEGRNSSLREFASLSNLNTLEIRIIGDNVLLPKVPIFNKLKIYKVKIYNCSFDHDVCDCCEENYMDDIANECKRVLLVSSSILIPSDRGGVDSLVRKSDGLNLHGEGCNYLVQELLRNGDDMSQQLKCLAICTCDTPEWLVNTMNPVHLSNATARATAVFPILQVLWLRRLSNLREICHGPVPALSLGELNLIIVQDCGRLGSLFQFQAPTVGCLTQLKRLVIRSCGMMEEVFIWKEQRGGVQLATNNRIEFPKLEKLELDGLRSLVGFCIGIDQIDFPKLESLRLADLGQLNCLSHNNGNPSSNSEQNEDIGFRCLFPQKVSLPNLKVLTLGYCNSLRYVFSPTMTKSIPQLRELRIFSCKMLSRIVAEEYGPSENTVDDVEFPQLEQLTLSDLPNLVSFFPKAKSTDHYHNPLQPQPLFNEKVAIPSLESLELSGLENVSDLWSSKLPTGAFSKLKKLHVGSCASLRNMIHPSMVGGLSKLQNLFIKTCSTSEAVVGKEEQVGGHGSKIEKTLFPELRILNLWNLPNLKRFCHFTHPLVIPLLRDVDISDCPNMDVFSLEPVSAPNLSLPNTSWKGDLNNAIPLLQEVKRKKLENLRKLLENQRKWEQNRRKEEENRRKWENRRKLEENRRKEEENRRKEEENENEDGDEDKDGDEYKEGDMDNQEEL